LLTMFLLFLPGKQLTVLRLLAPIVLGLGLMVALPGWRPELSIPGLIKLSPPSRPSDLDTRALVTTYLRSSPPSPTVLSAIATAPRRGEANSASQGLRQGYEQTHGVAQRLSGTREPNRQGENGR
jgi:hypothetical protein